MTRLFAGTPFDNPPKCDRCGDLESDCKCPPEEIAPERVAPDKQSVKVRVDRRKNKRLVTVVYGLSEPATDLKELLSKLKTACGAGGSISDSDLEIQGDHADRIKESLAEIGYRVR